MPGETSEAGTGGRGRRSSRPLGFRRTLPGEVREGRVESVRPVEVRGWSSSTVIAVLFCPLFSGIVP